MGDVELRAKLFSISECGLYKYGQTENSWGDVGDVFTGMKAWVANRSFGYTKTYNAQFSSDVLGTYVLDMKQVEPGDFFITLWNVVPTESDNRVIAAIDLSSQVGSPIMEIENFPEGYVPGFATYFWVMPNDNRFASLRFGSRYIGHGSFDAHIRNYLKYHCRYAVTEEVVPQEERWVIGYRLPSDADPKRYYPKFKSTAKYPSGDVDFIRQHVTEISHIYARGVIWNGSSLPESSRNLMRTINRVFRFNRTHQQIRLTLSIPIPRGETPLSLEELNAMLETWQRSELEGDYGFKIAGRNYWFGHKVKAGRVSVSIESTQPYINLDTITDVVQRRKEEILRSCEV